MKTVTKNDDDFDKDTAPRQTRGQEEEDEQEEEDFMSDKFVNEEKEKRPAITKKTSDGPVARRTKAMPSARVSLEQGMKSALPHNNKGFKLLAKMGYKEGTALKEGGRDAPIQVVFKNNKAGLGTERVDGAVAKRKRAVEETGVKAEERGPAKQRMPGPTVEDFRSTVAARKKEIKIVGLVERSIRVCRTLDEKAGVSTSPFWPNDGDANPEEERPEHTAFHSLEHPASKLEATVEYLRKSYCYCVFCGDKFASQDEMAELCPGASLADHDDD